MSLKPHELERLAKCLDNPYWRLNNLYYIIDKQGRKVRFQLNWAQQRLYEDTWYCNVILKARQIGISTYLCILFLDRCLFNPHMSAGIIAQTLDDVQHMFRRVKFAYDNLDPNIKSLITADNNTAQMLKFSNGSSIRVGTSMRGQTLQYLHVSEFGKICSKNPDKAREIVTGSLNTVAPGQYIFIESTAEGREGYFYDICHKAQEDLKCKADLSKLDFKFHFYPWHQEPSYRIGSVLPQSQEIKDYFLHLEELGITLDDQQKNWYISKESILKDDMKREFPTTPEESWETSNEGLYYGKWISNARSEGRITFVPYDDKLEVHTFWDLGYNDCNSIVFCQFYRNEIRIIDYAEGDGESLQFWINFCRAKPYTYGKMIGPHDILVHEYSSGLTRQSIARSLGMSMLAAKKTDIIPGIDAVRNVLSRCFFDGQKCSKLLKSLENYKKEWDDRNGCWRANPLHNWASHGADAFRVLATSLHYFQQTQTTSHNPNEWLQNKYSTGR